MRECHISVPSANHYHVHICSILRRTTNISITRSPSLCSHTMMVISTTRTLSCQLNPFKFYRIWLIVKSGMRTSEKYPQKHPEHLITVYHGAKAPTEYKTRLVKFANICVFHCVTLPRTFLTCLRSFLLNESNTPICTAPSNSGWLSSYIKML